MQYGNILTAEADMRIQPFSIKTDIRDLLKCEFPPLFPPTSTSFWFEKYVFFNMKFYLC